MKRVHPLNVDDLPQVVRQAQPSASGQIKSTRSFQIDRPKLSKKQPGRVNNILIYGEYPVNSITNDNDDMDNNLHIREKAPRGKLIKSEYKNTSSRNQNNAENDDKTSMALTLEKTHHEWIATLRANTFRAILSNKFDLTLFFSDSF